MDSVRLGGALSGGVHATFVAVAAFGWPTVQVFFADYFGYGSLRDVLAYGERPRFAAEYSLGALTEETGEGDLPSSGGIDPDDDVPNQSSGESGFASDGIGDADQTTAGQFDVDRRTQGPREEPDTGADRDRDEGAVGTGREPGGTGDSKTAGKATREIVVFVNLRPQPEPDADAQRGAADLAAGETGTPSVDSVAEDREAPEPDASDQVAAERASEVGSLVAGNPRDAKPAAELEGQEESFENDEQGDTGITADAPIRETGTEALTGPIADEASRTPSAEPASEAEPLDELAQSAPGEQSPETALAAIRATGSPGLIDAASPADVPDSLRADVSRSAPQVDAVIQRNVIDGLHTLGDVREDVQKPTLDDFEGGEPLRRIGRALGGIALDIDAPRGPASVEAQDAIVAPKGTQPVDIPDVDFLPPQPGQKEAEDDSESPTQLASAGDGSAPGMGPDVEEVGGQAPRAERPTLPAPLLGPTDPLRKLAVGIAGTDEKLARTLLSPKLGAGGAIAEGEPALDAEQSGRVSGDDLLAHRVLEEAAEAGYAPAAVRLAKRALSGEDPLVRPGRVEALLKDAAAAGDPDA